jgi:hypothetical protein
MLPGTRWHNDVMTYAWGLTDLLSQDHHHDKACAQRSIVWISVGPLQPGICHQMYQCGSTTARNLSSDVSVWVHYSQESVIRCISMGQLHPGICHLGCISMGPLNRLLIHREAPVSSSNFLRFPVYLFPIGEELLLTGRDVSNLCFNSLHRQILMLCPALSCLFHPMSC